MYLITTGCWTAIWLCKSSVKGKAYCSICNKDFDISNFGIAALDSHAAGKKLKDNIGSRVSRSSAFFVKNKMQVMMQKNVLVKAPIQQFEPRLYQQVLLMQKS